MPADADKIIKMFDQAQGRRKNWETHWQDIADLVLTSRSFITKHTPGTRRDRRVFDATAGKAVEKFSAALFGFLINPSIKWFALRTTQDAVNQREEVREWLNDGVNRMLALFSSTRFGFNTNAHESFLDIVAFGTAVIIFNELPDRIRFQARPLSECFLMANAEDKIDTVHRLFKVRPDRAVELFSEREVGSERVAEADRHGEAEFEILHSTFPRKDRIPGRRDILNKPFASVYIDLDKKSVIRETGFDDFPYLTPRWSKASGEIYGRSPTMTVLADIGMVNAMRKTNIAAAEQAVAPPYIVEASGIEGNIRFAPNSLIYRRTGSPKPIEPLITGNRVELGEAILDKERQGIREGFFLDMLTLPEVDRMTTVEVIQRIQQRLVFLAPMISRLIEEFLGPLISRTFSAMLRLGMFAPLPEALSGEEIEVDFVSTLAISQRASEANGFTQWFTALGTMAQADPSVLDILNSDEVARYSASTWFNVPARLLNSPQEIAQIRNTRAQAEQVAAALQSAQAAAAAGKDAGSAVKDLAAAGAEAT